MKMKFDANDPKAQRRFTTITVILVVLVGIIASWVRGDLNSTNAYLEFHNEGYLSITDQNGTVTEYAYAEMTEIIYVAEMDVGEAVDGEVVDETMLGTWYSEKYGEYQACLQEDIACCIYIQTDHGACAINYESEETTESLYEAILKESEAAE